MPENIVALIYVLAVATAIFVVGRRPIVENFIDPADYARRRNLWFAITLLLFLSYSYWIYTIVSGILIAACAKRDRNPLAIYSLLLCIAPPHEISLSGLGIVNRLFDLDHYRFLSLLVLLPLAVRLYQTRHDRAPPPKGIDAMVRAYVFVVFASYGVHSESATAALRSCFQLTLDMWLPYYCASRALRDRAAFRDVAASLVIGMAIMGVLGAFESARHWLLYDSLKAALGLPPADFLSYLGRGSDGPLRALVTMGHPIVLGYSMAVTLAFFLFLAPKLTPRWVRWAAAGALAMGLISPFSRGPWLGAAAMLLTVSYLGRGGTKRVVRLGCAVGFATVFLLMTPLSDKVFRYLPFVGNVETDTIDYRKQLFDVSVVVLKQNPWLGDPFFLQNPLMEQMRQGQGIIDMVNTYLQIALPYGVIGLILFVIPFVSSMRSVWKTARQHDGDEEIERLGRTLVGAVVAILVTISTVSSIMVLPIMYWFVLGLCGSFIAAFATVRAPGHVRMRSAIPTVEGGLRQRGR